MAQKKSKTSKTSKTSKKILSVSKATKMKLGSYYHPTKTTYRTGKCPEGKILRKGYTKKKYVKKDGTVVKSTKVKPSCVKDTGLPGKTIKSSKVIKINKEGELKQFGYSTSINSKKRLLSLKKAVKKLTYKSVLLRLSALRTLTKRSNPKAHDIYNIDMKNLKLWKMTKKPTKKSTKKPTKKSTKKPTKKPTKKLIKKITKRSTKKVTKRSTKK